MMFWQLNSLEEKEKKKRENTSAFTTTATPHLYFELKSRL